MTFPYRVRNGSTVILRLDVVSSYVVPHLGNLFPDPIYKTRRANSYVRSGGCLRIIHVPVTGVTLDAVVEIRNQMPLKKRRNPSLSYGGQWHIRTWLRGCTRRSWCPVFEDTDSDEQWATVTRQGITSMFDMKRFWRRRRDLFLYRLQCSIIQVIFRDSCISTSFVGLWRWSRLPLHRLPLELSFFRIFHNYFKFCTYILGQNFIWNHSSDFNVAFVGSVLTNDSGLGNNYDIISGDDCTVEGSLCGTIGG